jgi:hypothetical protein
MDVPANLDYMPREAGRSTTVSAELAQAVSAARDVENQEAVIERLVVGDQSRPPPQQQRGT